MKILFIKKTPHELCITHWFLRTIGSFTWMLILFSYLYINCQKKKKILVCTVENMSDVVSKFTKQVHLFTWEKQQEKAQQQDLLKYYYIKDRCRSVQQTSHCSLWIIFSFWFKPCLDFQIWWGGLASLPRVTSPCCRKPQVGPDLTLPSCGSRSPIRPRCCQVLTTMAGIFKELASNLVVISGMSTALACRDIVPCHLSFLAEPPVSLHKKFRAGTRAVSAVQAPEGHRQAGCDHQSWDSVRKAEITTMPLY